MNDPASQNLRTGLLRAVSTYRRDPWFLVVLSILAAGVFVLPWYIPHPEPVRGESYAFGYFNLVALCGICLAMAAEFFRLRRVPGADGALVWLNTDAAPALDQEARLQRILLWGFSLAMSLFVLGWSWLLVDPYWGESGYFLSRIDYVSLGFQPYRDFLYNYGPLLLQLPVWINHLSLGTVGIEASYALTLALGYVAGVAALYVFLRALRLPAGARVWVLLLQLLCWCTPTMGLQGILLRFTIVPCAMVLVHHGLQRLAGTRRAAAGILLAAAAPLAAFAVSPEMGMSAAAGLLAYAVVLFLSRRWRDGVGMVLGLAGYGLLTRWLFGGYFQSMVGFGSGAFNFPIYPTLHTLLFLAACLFIFPFLAVSIWKHPAHPAAPLAAALSAASVVLLPAALGRCDPGHIQANGLIALVLVFPALAFLHRKAYRSWCIITVLVFVGVVQLSYWSHYADKYRLAWRQSVAARQHPEFFKQAAAKWQAERQRQTGTPKPDWRKIVAFPDGLPEITRQGRVVTPLAIDTSVERCLVLQDGFRPLYRPPCGNDMFFLLDVRHDLQACLAADFVLLPAACASCTNTAIDLPDYEQRTRDFLSRLLLYPVTSRLQHPPFCPEIELACRLLAAGDPVSQGRVLLLKVRPSADAGQGQSP